MAFGKEHLRLALSATLLVTGVGSHYVGSGFFEEQSRLLADASKIRDNIKADLGRPTDKDIEYAREIISVKKTKPPELPQKCIDRNNRLSVMQSAACDILTADAQTWTAYQNQVSVSQIGQLEGQGRLHGLAGAAASALIPIGVLGSIWIIRRKSTTPQTSAPVTSAA